MKLFKLTQIKKKNGKLIIKEKIETIKKAEKIKLWYNYYKNIMLYHYLIYFENNKKINYKFFK